MSRRKRKRGSGKPVGGGGARNPRSLANLRGRTSREMVGNSNSRKHGAFGEITRERIEAEERRVLDAISADLPLRERDGSVPAADGVMVTLLARALIRLQRVEDYHAAHGWLTEENEPRSSVDLERRLRVEVADLCDALAMSPRSRAKLNLDLVHGEKSLIERMAEARHTVEGEAEEVGGEG